MIPVKYDRLHQSKTNTKLEWISSMCGFVFIVSVPPIHMLVLWYFWQDYSRAVDKSSCSCSCWDTVFKGTYETGVATYKHFYFNATENMFKIWFILVAFLVLLHECVRWLVSLWLTSRLRGLMAILFFSSLFSHYYAWWVYTNYYNDEYYKQWYHQLFFTVTELFSTVAVLWLCTKEHNVTPTLAGVIIGIATMHVIAASKDQFMENVIKGEGAAHQIVRDVGFMIPDLMHIAIPLICLKKWNCNNCL